MYACRTFSTFGSLSIPNLLSISRIVASPLTAMAVVNHNYSVAFGLVAWGAVSDLLDGWTARRLKQESKLGSILDPIGDKTMTVFVASALTVDGLMPIWLCSALIGRDLLLLGSTCYFKLKAGYQSAAPAANLPQVHPFLSGKIHTSIQFLLFAIYLVFRPGEDDKQKNSRAKWVSKRILESLLSITLIWSTLSYAKGYRSAIRF